MPRSKKRKLSPKNIARKADENRTRLKYAALLADHMRLMAVAIILVRRAGGNVEFTDGERKAIPPGTALSIEKGNPGITLVTLEAPAPAEVSPIVGAQGEALAAATPEGVRGATEA
jgi:hypothetical protein